IQASQLVVKIGVAKTGVTIDSFSSSNSHSVACSLYHKLPFVLVCREGHPRLSENPTREEILNENFTAYLNDENSFKDYQEKAESLLTKRNIVYRSDSFISLLSMIGSSDLIGLVPMPAFEKYGPALNLRKVETDIQFPSIDIYMMYNRSALNSSAFASFIEEISLP
ncbi:LysR substrate-binding domain-containing protein, partial [Enterobacter asburiae]|uniref:LysR substrate-binding domain-containing protein n=1 Tax=Enterobacter asburiae TaxID=61645 RepID=UPI001F14D66A